MLDTLKTQLPMDIVYLCLHGAGVVDKTPDLEGDLAESVRTLPDGRRFAIVVFTKSSTTPEAYRDRAIAEISQPLHDLSLLSG